MCKRKSIGIRTKVLLISSLANLIFTVCYTVYSYKIQKSEIIEGINGKLTAAAQALPAMLPSDFHDSAVDANSIDPVTYERVLKQLSQYADEIGITYLYSYVKDGDGFHVASTNATPEEIESGTQTEFFQMYEQPPASMLSAWDSGQSTFDEYTDEWGSFRSIFVPMQTAEGKRFIVGADISTGFIRETLAQTLAVCIGFGVGVFLLLWVIASVLLNKTVRPIGDLTETIRRTAEQNFALNEEQRTELELVADRCTSEVGQLSSAFLDMDAKLQRYIVDLQETTAAKERVEGELKIAWEIQQNFLPQVLPSGVSADKFDLHAFLTPAKAVGGDLYDFYMMRDDRLCFAIGDVSDKGVPAAITMAVTLTLFRSLGQNFDGCDALMTDLNNALCRHVTTGQFVTMLAGVIDGNTGEVVYSHAGHNPPYVMRAASGTVEPLHPDIRPFLGAMEEIDYVANNIKLEPGDCLFLYTDGITEAFCKDGTYYGDDRLQAFLESIAEQSYDVRGDR